MRIQSALLICSLFVALTLAACGGGEPEPAAPAETPAAAAPAEEAEAPAAEAEPTEAAAAPTEETPAEEAPAAEAPAENVVIIEPGNPIRIGGSFGLTGPIPDAGKDEQQAAELAADDLNAAGGIMGFQVEIVVEDGACSGDAGTVVANKFAAAGDIVAVTGGMCSGETFGLTPILQQARIPFVSPSATNPDITSPECDICNRVALDDALQAQVDAEFAYNELGLRKAAVMHDNSDYGLGLAQYFSGSFQALGGEVTDLEGIQVGDTDFRAVLARIGANQPELIFFGGYSTEAGLIAQQKLETSGLEEANFMGTDGSYLQQYLDVSGSAGEGTYVSFVATNTNEEAMASFTEKYVAKYGVEPDQLGPFHGQSYDSVNLIAAAINQVAQIDDQGRMVIDREALITAIRGTQGLQGLTGTLTCDEIGNCGAGGIAVFTVTDGEFELVYGYGAE